MNFEQSAMSSAAKRYERSCTMMDILTLLLTGPQTLFFTPSAEHGDAVTKANTQKQRYGLIMASASTENRKSSISFPQGAAGFRGRRPRSNASVSPALPGLFQRQQRQGIAVAD